ncbi:MAG: ATP-binding protein, partial [Gammaproteobacteria bacterium]
MTTDATGQMPRWLSYAVTFILGLAFGITLFSITWNNALDGKIKEFTFELVSLKETVAHNVLVSNDIINSLNAFISANPKLSGQQFNLFSQEILSQHPFIKAVIYYPWVKKTEVDAFNKRLSDYTGSASHRLEPTKNTSEIDYYLPVLFQVSRDVNVLSPGHDINSDNIFSDVIRSMFLPDASAPVPSVFTNDKGVNYGIFKVLFRDDHSSISENMDKAIKGVISIIVEPADIFGQNTLPSDLAVTLHTESPSISGRQLLYNKEINSAVSEGWLISTLSTENKIQLPSYSINLNISKNIYWDDVEKKLIYIALFIGAGVTLLLIALVRAKDLQAKELRERNIMIERTVDEQTKELAWARDTAIKGTLMKSEFLASMSHEIRTPLNAIIGMSELLSETKLTDEQEKYISVFRRAGNTLLSLVNDILDLSKIEAHQLSLEEIKYNLVDVIEESVEIYALKAAEKKVELVGRVDPLVNNYRLGDPTRLRQILLNLISNALKFTEQGEIIVNVSNSEKEDDPDQVVFSVRDTGIGISEEKLQSIFESFTQADSSTTREYGGTGLGLTISKSLVELMHGKIWVES